MTEKNPLLIKKHWHLLVFEVAQVGLPKKVSMYTSTVRKLPSIPEISRAQAERSIPADAVMVGHSYLGFGSQCELTGQPAVPPPSSTSTFYLEGLEAAITATDMRIVENPYDGDQHLPHQRQEWVTGFQVGANMRGANPAARIDKPIK